VQHGPLAALALLVFKFYYQGHSFALRALYRMVCAFSKQRRDTKVTTALSADSFRNPPHIRPPIPILVELALGSPFS